MVFNPPYGERLDIQNAIVLQFNRGYIKAKLLQEQIVGLLHQT